MNVQDRADVARTLGKRTVTESISNLLKRAGFSNAGIGCILLLAILPLIPPFNKEHLIRWLIGGTYLAAQAVAFDFTAGYINIVNFGFAAILGFGAYTSAILSDSSGRLLITLGLPPWLTIFLGAFGSAIVGFLLGVLTLRLRGIFAAVMSWFVGLALLGLARNLTPLTRGPLGLHPPPLIDTPHNLPYFYVIFTMLVVIYAVSKLVANSYIGLAFKAIGQNIDAAKASGINPTVYRVLNFTLSCFFAGLLGGFYAHYYRSLTPQTIMHTSKTVEVLAVVYIGGRGSLWGGAVTAFPSVFLMEYLRSGLPQFPGIHLVIYGILMIITMIFYPGGVAEIIRKAASVARERRMS